jgi:agmatine deiminase
MNLHNFYEELKMGKTPLQNGFHMPAEWEKHEGTWLQWPHEDRYKGYQMRLETVWLAMTEALHRHEVVHITVIDERRKEHLITQFEFYGFDLKNIDVHILPTDDVWARDNGPIFLINDKQELAITDWNFNGWGGRIPSEKDSAVPKRIAELLSIPYYKAPIVLEGGGIEVNGKGTLLATRSSIINPNRNPNKSQAEIEDALRQYLGVNHFIWITGTPPETPEPLRDITDFHADGAARFVDEATVLYNWTDNKSDPAYPYFERHLSELREAETESRKKLTLIPLPVPKSEIISTMNNKTKPPFTAVPSYGLYINYYVANNVVIVPVYGDVNDVKAKNMIAEHYPGREIIGIPAHVTAELGGMIHCVTQQQPAV